MNTKAVRWLLGELPTLVETGVLAPDAAQRLREHYGRVEIGSGRRVALIVCAIAGVLLIGLGINLLVAHNWEALTRATRTAIIFSVLAAAQGLAVWALRWRASSIAWRESTAALLFLLIGGAIALIGQTYHISGDPGAFMLCWMLLGIPLVYLHDASVPAALYLVGITGWSGCVRYESGNTLWFWLLLALVLPHYWLAVRANRQGIRPIFLGWVLALSLSVALGITHHRALPGLWILIYSAFFALLYLAGRRGLSDGVALWQRPFFVVGALGTVILSAILTYDEPWRDIRFDRFRPLESFQSFSAIADYVITGVLLLAAAGLLLGALRRREREQLLLGVAPWVGLVGYGLASTVDRTLPPVVLFNVYLLALAVGLIALGLKDLRLARVNGGLVILALWIGLRFFDVDMSFVLRGVAFILIGLGFLAANVALLRRKGEVR